MLRCHFHLKKCDITESRYGQNIPSCSSSQRLEQVVDQGLRNGKGVYTIRDSYYHKENGTEKTQWEIAANTSKVC